MGQDTIQLQSNTTLTKLNYYIDMGILRTFKAKHIKLKNLIIFNFQKKYFKYTRTKVTDII